MKKIVLIIISFIFLTWCSIDWNNEKDKKIDELNNKIGKLEQELTDLKISNDIELQKLEFEKQKYEKEKLYSKEKSIDKQNEIYRKECLEEQDMQWKNYEDFINKCTTYWNTIDFCINSPAGKLFSTFFTKDYISKCIEEKSL